MSFNVKVISTLYVENSWAFLSYNVLWSVCYADGMLSTEKLFLFRYKFSYSWALFGFPALGTTDIFLLDVLLWIDLSFQNGIPIPCHPWGPGTIALINSMTTDMKTMFQRWHMYMQICCQKCIIIRKVLASSHRENRNSIPIPFIPSVPIGHLCEEITSQIWQQIQMEIKNSLDTSDIIGHELS